ncbi:hypothetical protein F4677DRAFT_345317 [Hypoxylon crocopeplum]|nr:hypothetical protein F4677DRAFT_345317 [Hypoxylon crocopeplum]
MSDLMRLSRPWLLSPFQPRAPSPILFSLFRTISTTAPRPYAFKGKRSRPSRSAVRKSDMKGLETAMTLLIPYTFVAPPLWRYPRHPTKFVHMLWLHVKARFSGLLGLLSTKLASQPTTIFSKPRFQFHRSAVIPTAKAMHVQMSEAIAAGDKETLRNICTPELFQTLGATIDARPKGVRAEWELVCYYQRWRYPRLADCRVGFRPSQNGSMSPVKQAVVSIASVQKITSYDTSKGGVKIAGSERVRHLTEHIVLQAVTNKDTYESGPWKIWGTLSETNYEEYLAETKDMESIGEQART